MLVRSVGVDYYDYLKCYNKNEILFLQILGGGEQSTDF